MVNLWGARKAPFAHEHATRTALAGDVCLTSRQIANRGGSWRAVMDLLANGELEIVGVTARAQVLFKRTGG